MAYLLYGFDKSNNLHFSFINCIQMSRESAIVFLRDIRSNIANLQSVYMDQDTTMKMTTMGVEKV